MDFFVVNIAIVFAGISTTINTYEGKIAFELKNISSPLIEVL